MTGHGGCYAGAARVALSGARLKAVVLGVISISLIVSAGWPGIADADEPEDFVPGAAAARADTIKVAAQVGGIDIGLSLGRSLANYQGSFAVGEGRALDLEALPFLIGEATACEGVVPLLPDAALPELTLVESTQDGSEESHRTETFFPEIKGGQSDDSAGWQDASSSDQPWATASTETPTQWMGLFDLHNPTTEVTAQLIDGVREATATMTADSLSIFNGLITLQGLRWEATVKSGGETVTDGSFSVRSGTLFGLHRTPEQAIADVATFGDVFAQIFGFLGAAIDMPEVIVEDQRVEVTPLVFRFTDLPIGRHLVGPLLDLFSGSVDEFYEDLRASGCEGESIAQIVELAEGVLRGNGSIVLPIGGVLVSTDDTYVEPLVLDFGIPAPESAPAEPVVSAPPPAIADVALFAPEPLAFETSFDLGTDFSGPDLGVGGPTPTPIEAPAALPPTTAPPPPEREESATGADTPIVQASAARTIDGSRGGVATTIGALTVLAALLMALGDRSVMTRGRRRVIPDD